jgi:hypothetical protein
MMDAKPIWHIGEVRNVSRVLVGNLREMNHLKDLGVHVKDIIQVDLRLKRCGME